MKKIKALALLALLIVSPLILAAGSGGFPSRPQFQKVTINQKLSSDNSLTLNRTDGTPGIILDPTGTNGSRILFGAHYDGSGNIICDDVVPSVLNIAGGYDFATKVCNPGDIWVPTYNFSVQASGAAGVFRFHTSPQSDKACPAGFTRLSPNFCAFIGTVVTTALVRDTCTTNATLPNDAKAVLLHVEAFARSANAVATRDSRVQAFTGNTCATVLRDAVWSLAYEHTAVAASAALGADSNDLIIDLDASADFFLKFVDDAGNFGTASYTIAGYFD